MRMFGIYAAAALVGCDPSGAMPPADDSAHPDTAEAGLCDSGTSLTWQNFGQSYFVDYCTECHDPANPMPGVPDYAEVNFETESTVWSLRDRILARIVYQPNALLDALPPDPDQPLMDADLRWQAVERQRRTALLEEWLVCGAPPD